MGKKRFSLQAIVILVCFFISLIGVSPAFSKDKEVKFLRMVASVPAGSWWPLGGKICQLLQESYPGVSASVVPGGGTQNCITVNKDGIESVGWTYTAAAGLAVKGVAPFKKPMKNLRHVASLYTNTLHLAVQVKSGINTIPDFRTRKIAVGNKAAWFTFLNEKLIEQYGFDYNAIEKSGGTVNYLLGRQMLSMYQDNNLDSIWLGLPGVPYPLMVHLNKVKGFRLLEIDEPQRNSLIAEIPGVVKAVIPKGSYANINQDINTIGSVTSIVCNKNLPDDFVYALTKVLWENQADLAKINKLMATVDMKRALNGAVAPVHPGALAYYKENGVSAE